MKQVLYAVRVLEDLSKQGTFWLVKKIGIALHDPTIAVYVLVLGVDVIALYFASHRGQILHIINSV